MISTNSEADQKKNPFRKKKLLKIFVYFSNAVDSIEMFILRHIKSLLGRIFVPIALMLILLTGSNSCIEYP